MAGTAATAVAIGSLAWYYHLYGTELHAMTMTEEGLVYKQEASVAWDGYALIQIGAGDIENLTLKPTSNYLKGRVN
jgi:hypothetical protein